MSLKELRRRSNFFSPYRWLSKCLIVFNIDNFVTTVIYIPITCLVFYFRPEYIFLRYHYINFIDLFLAIKMTILLIVTPLDTSTKTSKYHPRGNMGILTSNIVCSVRSTPPPPPPTSGAEPTHYSPRRSLSCMENSTLLSSKRQLTSF